MPRTHLQLEGIPICTWHQHIQTDSYLVKCCVFENSFAYFFPADDLSISAIHTPPHIVGDSLVIIKRDLWRIISDVKCVHDISSSSWRPFIITLLRWCRKFCNVSFGLKAPCSLTQSAAQSLASLCQLNKRKTYNKMKSPEERMMDDGVTALFVSAVALSPFVYKLPQTAGELKMYLHSTGFTGGCSEAGTDFSFTVGAAEWKRRGLFHFIVRLLVSSLKRECKGLRTTLASNAMGWRSAHLQTKLLLLFSSLHTEYST